MVGEWGGVSALIAVRDAEMKKAFFSHNALKIALCTEEGFLRNSVVPTEGLEPPHLAAHGPEPCASTNSATWALILLNNSAIITTGRVSRQMNFRSLLHINPV